MKAASSAAIAATLALLLGGCMLTADPPVPTPAAVVVAPVPVDYSCAQQQQLRKELDAIPGSMLEQAMEDYGTERRKLRAVHGLPEPAMCPKERS